MTFGIDVSTWQAGMDFAQAKAEGVQFVIVKAVAANNPSHAVADEYHTHIDKVSAVGLPKGHYLINNSQNTPVQSATFMANNLYRATKGDVLALDNEPLGTYATFWKEAQCVQFFQTLHALTGHPYNRMWLYCPAALTRQNGPYKAVEALGVKIWWVSYGDMDPYREAGEEPFLGTAVSAWQIHQYSSVVPVAGRKVDGNYSPLPVSELFGTSIGEEEPMAYFAARPAKGNMNQGFGPRPKPTATSPAIHYGQDYGWGGGDPIYAARAGKVIAYAYAGAYGNRMIVDHGNGRHTWYCHLRAPHVAVGATVKGGQQIAWMGATGNVTAKHLHFEFRVSGNAVDPEPFFSTGTPAGGDVTPIEEVIENLIREEDEMKFVFGHRNEGDNEWILIHPELRGARADEVGYLVTTDEAEATAWARMYKNGWSDKLVGDGGRYDFDVNRAAYIKIQQAATRVAVAYAK